MFAKKYGVSIAFKVAQLSGCSLSHCNQSKVNNWSTKSLQCCSTLQDYSELLKKKEQCKSNCCVDSFVGERALVHGATRKGAKDEAGEFEPRKAWACEKAEAAAWGRWSAVSGAVQHTILRSQQHRAQQGTAAGAGGPCQKPGSWKGSCSNRQIVLFFPSSVHFKLNFKKNL